MTTGWIAMVEHAQRPEVAAVGPQLLYRDGTVQHAGMFLANNGIGRHAFRFAAKRRPVLFRAGADAAQCHGGYRRLHAGPPRYVRAAWAFRRSASDHQQ